MVIAISLLVLRTNSSPSAKQSLTNEYEINAIEPIKNRVGYPYVWMPVDIPPYRLTVALEYLRILNSQYSHILLAKKRISELLKWGQRTHILQEVPISSDPSETVEALKAWQERHMLKRQVTKLSPYNAWESSLARYLNHYEVYLEYGKDNETTTLAIERNLTVAKELREDEGILTRSIRMQAFSVKDKQYLLALTSAIFTHLYKISGTGQSSVDPNIYAYYSLQDIAASNNAGLYTAYVRTREMPATQSAILTIGKKQHDSRQFIFQPYNKEFFLVSNVPVSVTDTYASIKVPQLEAKKILRTNNDESIHTYKYTISEDERRLNYLLSFEFESASTSALIEVKKQSIIIDTAQNKYLNRTMIPLRRAYRPSAAAQQFEDVIYTGSQELVQSFAVTVSYSDPTVPKRFDVHLYPMYEPDLTLIKDKDAFFPVAAQAKKSPGYNLVIFVLTVLIMGLIFYIKRQFVMNLYQRLHSKITVLLLTLTIVSFLIDVILIQSFGEIYLFALFFWILFSLLTSLKPDTSFKIGFILFLILILIRPLNQPILAEKVARWIIILIGWGGIHYLLVVRRKGSREISIAEYISETLGKAPARIWSLYGRTILRAAGILIAAGIFISAGYYVFFNRGDRPTIAFHEPSIVYESNVVLLRGSRFGTNKDNKSRLMTDFGPIPHDTWTDTKITFTIPDILPNESVSIWIERSGVVSNKVPVRIISSTNGWDEQDEEYFKQLEILSDETLRLNKYR